MNAALLTDPVAAAAVLASGGIVAFPTETFFGLAADAANPEALTRLAAVKGRPESKPFPLIVGDADQFRAFFAAPEAEQVAMERLAARFWPGPLSVIVPPLSGIAPRLLDADGRACVRVSGHAAARALALALGRPITATSANPAGEPPTTEAALLDRAMLVSVQAVLDAAPRPAGGQPSTLVRPEGGMRLWVFRDGAVSRQALMSAGFSLAD